MKDQPEIIVPTIVQETITQETIGDRIRKVADRLNQETQIQIKATSRILGAAAQIAQNQDRLIDEVVEMVEEDLKRQEDSYTVDRLKQQFKSINDAKSHFNIKANSWANLVDKLNRGKSTPASSPKTSSKKTTDARSSDEAIVNRLDKIEADLQILRIDLSAVLEAIERVEQRIR